MCAMGSGAEASVRKWQITPREAGGGPRGARRRRVLILNTLKGTDFVAGLPTRARPPRRFHGWRQMDLVHNISEVLPRGAVVAGGSLHPKDGFLFQIGRAHV